MHTSDTINDISAALAKAQGVFINPAKNREVTVRTDKGNYTFAYATLDAILDIVRPALAQAGIAMVQVVEPRDGGGQQVTTRLLHGSGQWIETSLPIVVEGTGNQKFGSALTYMRRYSIISLLGLAAEEDDDGNAADGNQAEGHDRHPQGGFRQRSAAPAHGQPKAPPAPPAAPATSQSPAALNALRTAFDRAAAATSREQAMESLIRVTEPALGRRIERPSEVPANLVKMVVDALDQVAGLQPNL